MYSTIKKELNNMPLKSENIVPGVIIAICAAALGFGVSQATLAIDVKSHSVEISNIKEEQKRALSMQSDDRSMVREIIRQNQEFINLLRVQNELLLKRNL